MNLYESIYESIYESLKIINTFFVDWNILIRRAHKTPFPEHSFYNILVIIIKTDY